MTVIQEWVRGLVFSGAVCSVALMLSPDGRVKKVLKLLCGAVMCIAFISPAAQLDFGAYSKAMAKYSLEAESYIHDGENESKNLNRTIIQDKCEAYILDKANTLGAEIISVDVLARWSEEGYWYPVSADICAACSVEEKSCLEDYIQAQLGIKRDDQTWSEAVK